MSERPAVDVALLRGLEEYLDEVEETTDPPSADVDADDLLLTFCREMYNQFFSGVLGQQVESPGHASRVRIGALRKRESSGWDGRVDRVVHGYLKFCPLYEDLLSGLRYEREEAVSSFHLGFVPKMLDEFLHWAASVPDVPLVKAVAAAKQRYTKVVETWRRESRD